MTPEQILDKQIMIWCSKQDWLCFHINVGKIKFFDEKQGKYRIFDTGVPPGWPDLQIITDKGQVFYCETKVHPRKPTADQLKMIKILNDRNILAFVAYSLEEFIEVVEKEIK